MNIPVWLFALFESWKQYSICPLSVCCQKGREWLIYDRMLGCDDIGIYAAVLYAGSHRNKKRSRKRIECLTINRSICSIPQIPDTVKHGIRDTHRPLLENPDHGVANHRATADP